MSLVSGQSLWASNLSSFPWREGLGKPKVLSTRLDLQHGLRAHHSSHSDLLPRFKKYKIHGFPLQGFKCPVHRLIGWIYKLTEKKTFHEGHLPPPFWGSHSILREPLELCSAFSHSVLTQTHYFSKHLPAVCWATHYTGDHPPQPHWDEIFLRGHNRGDSGNTETFWGSPENFLEEVIFKQ